MRAAAEKGCDFLNETRYTVPMEYMDDVRKWIAVYRLLDQVSTEAFDCGMLCKNACCTGRNMPYPLLSKTDRESPAHPLRLSAPRGGGAKEALQSSSDLGIYLFPGEQLLLKEMEDSGWLDTETQDPKDIGFPASWTGPVYFVKCKTPPVCPRKWRPLQCRTFPLKPVFGGSGVLELIWNDEKLPYRCPLIEENAPIHDDFYRATYTVWSHLVKDPRIFDLVMMWS